MAHGGTHGRRRPATSHALGPGTIGCGTRPGSCRRLTGSPGSPSGGPDPRLLWPNILEAVKNRRRFTWILLSQNAQVTGFDGTTLQIGFVNAGARDNFASSGSEEVLRQALSEQFNVQWKIDAIVDTSGGSGGPGGSAAPAPAGPGFGGGYGGAQTAPTPHPSSRRPRHRAPPRRRASR